MNSHMLERWSRVIAVAGAVLLASACDVTDLDDQFMIRRPIDSLLGGAPSFTATATGTNSLNFEWEPVSGATSYSIVFKNVEFADSMNTLRGDPMTDPTFTFQVSNTTVSEVKIDPNNEDPDALTVRVVTHQLTAPQIHAALVEAGVEEGGLMNTLYAVVAHRGSTNIRSVEVQRMILRRQ